MTPAPELAICGDIVVAAGADGLERAEAVAIGGGRIVAVGRRSQVLDAIPAGTRVVDAGRSAVIPGLHDFHVHLAGLARSRADVSLDDAADAREIAARLRARLAALAPDAWLTGRGWTEAQLQRGGAAALREAVGERLAFLSSHDGHSAWVSPAALRAAQVDARTPDPAGGRIEHDELGGLTGVLRETAFDLVDGLVPRLRGDGLRPHLAATLRELAAFGMTGATEAGDQSDENGAGRDAALGDSYSTLTDLANLLDGRLRMSIGIPVDALGAARARGLRTGVPLEGTSTLRFGWAKEYADGALGSGTAATFVGADDAGILRVTPGKLDELYRASRHAGIALAVHAIGDRAAAEVLDAAERAGPRPAGATADRIEHVQLVRAPDRARFAALGMTASIQPIHAAADRDLAEAAWPGREDDAYPWRRLADGGALLAAGSDAPIESVDPWLGLFAAVHRRLPSDRRGDWTPAQALRIGEALGAYTLGPARALGVADEGHLRIGARADLAVLDIGVEELLNAGDRMATARSVLTLVDGNVVHEA